MKTIIFEKRDLSPTSIVEFSTMQEAKKNGYRLHENNRHDSFKNLELTEKIEAIDGIGEKLHNFKNCVIFVYDPMFLCNTNYNY